MKQDLVNNVLVENTIVPDAHGTGTVTGDEIDLQGFNSAMVIVNAGTNGTGGTVDVKIQHGDEADGSDMADVTDGAFTQITEANDNATYQMGYFGTKRYIRAVATVGTAACDFGVCVAKGHPRTAPVSYNS